MPDEFEPRRLTRRALQIVAALAVVGLVLLLAPGLGEVRDLLTAARPGWLALAVAFEAMSCVSYVLVFRPVFCQSSRSIERGGEVHVFNDRGAFECAARVSDDARPGVLVAPMGWWNRDYAGDRSARATTPATADGRGNAPTFNDNRVEVAPA